MADVKISALPAATTPLSGDETLALVQGGLTKKATRATLLDPVTLDQANGRLGLGDGAAAPTNLFHLQSTTALSTRGFFAQFATDYSQGVECLPVMTGPGVLVQGWRFFTSFEPLGGMMNNGFGLNFQAKAENSSEAMNNLIGIVSGVRTGADYTGALLNAIGMNIVSPAFDGAVTGLLIYEQSGGVANYALRTQGGDHELGGPAYPGGDNLHTLGTAGRRWSEVYAATGTINTSDARLKADVNDISGDEALAFLEGLRPVNYRERDGGGADGDGAPLPGVRRHFGLIAQEVEDHAAALGLDFAGFTKTPQEPYEIITGSEEVEDPANPGETVQQPVTATVTPEFAEIYGLRYHEFIAPLIAAVKELTARNAALEGRVAALEAA